MERVEKKPLAVHRFPASQVLRSGGRIVCSFDVALDEMGNDDVFFSVDAAVLYGVEEMGKESHAARLAHILDTLNHFSEGIPERWGKGDCDPKRHIDRALRELTQAMLALDDHDD